MEPCAQSLARRCALLTFSVLLLLAPALRADVVIRYKTDLKLAPYLPAEALEQFQKSGQAPLSQSMGMKGNKGYSDAGGIRAIVDFNTQEVTMVDASQKRYVTFPVSQFAEKMMPKLPEVPEEARKMLESMQTSFDSRQTGRTEVIQGIQAEERELTFSLSIPVPDSEGASVPTIKIVTQVWTPKAGEALRVQAIRELTAYNLWNTQFMNPAQALQKSFAAFPGFGKSFGHMFETLSGQNAVMLRMHVAFYGPMAQMAKMTSDPNAPMVEMTQEISELSTAAVDDAMFQVPGDYKLCSPEELLQMFVKPGAK